MRNRCERDRVASGIKTVRSEYVPRQGNDRQIDVGEFFCLRTALRETIERRRDSLPLFTPQVLVLAGIANHVLDVWQDQDITFGFVLNGSTRQFRGERRS